MQVVIAVLSLVAGILLGFFIRSNSAKRESALLEQRNREAIYALGALQKQLAQAQTESASRAGFESLAAERDKTIARLASERRAPRLLEVRRQWRRYPARGGRACNRSDPYDRNRRVEHHPCLLARRQLYSVCERFGVGNRPDDGQCAGSHESAATHVRSRQRQRRAEFQPGWAADRIFFVPIEVSPDLYHGCRWDERSAPHSIHAGGSKLSFRP